MPVSISRSRIARSFCSSLSAGNLCFITSSSVDASVKTGISTDRMDPSAFHARDGRPFEDAGIRVSLTSIFPIFDVIFVMLNVDFLEFNRDLFRDLVYLYQGLIAKMTLFFGVKS